MILHIQRFLGFVGLFSLNTWHRNNWMAIVCSQREKCSSSEGSVCPGQSLFMVQSKEKVHKLLKRHEALKTKFTSYMCPSSSRRTCIGHCKGLDTDDLLALQMKHETEHEEISFTLQ